MVGACRGALLLAPAQSHSSIRATSHLQERTHEDLESPRRQRASATLLASARARRRDRRGRDRHSRRRAPDRPRRAAGVGCADDHPDPRADPPRSVRPEEHARRLRRRPEDRSRRVAPLRGDLVRPEQLRRRAPGRAVGSPRRHPRLGRLRRRPQDRPRRLAPSYATWYVINSSGAARQDVQWGVTGDIPVPGDYDGDGKTDRAVWRTDTATWYVLNSSGAARQDVQWGVAGDIPGSWRLRRRRQDGSRRLSALERDLVCHQQLGRGPAGRPVGRERRHPGRGRLRRRATRPTAPYSVPRTPPGT